MTKKISGIILTIVLAVVIFFLNRPMGETPAMGMFLSPTHGFWKSTALKQSRNTTIELKCLKGVATIVYDELGVPHIFAEIGRASCRERVSSPV